MLLFLLFLLFCLKVGLLPHQGCGRKRPWPNLKQCYVRMIKKFRKMFFGSKFGPSIWILSRNTTHMTWCSVQYRIYSDHDEISAVEAAGNRTWRWSGGRNLKGELLLLNGAETSEFKHHLIRDVAGIGRFPSHTLVPCLSLSLMFVSLTLSYCAHPFGLYSVSPNLMSLFCLTFRSNSKWTHTLISKQVVEINKVLKQSSHKLVTKLL